MREQVDLLRNLVKEIHEQGEAASSERAADVKVAKLTDIEVYLTMFERQMITFEDGPSS